MKYDSPIKLYILIQKNKWRTLIHLLFSEKKRKITLEDEWVIHEIFFPPHPLVNATHTYCWCWDGWFLNVRVQIRLNISVGASLSYPPSSIFFYQHHYSHHCKEHERQVVQLLLQEIDILPCLYIVKSMTIKTSKNSCNRVCHF